MRQAIADFDEAIARDAGFAPAYAALAEAHLWLYSGVGILPARETVPQARWAVEQALALDPTLADAHKVRGADRHEPRLGSTTARREALTRALELGPGSAAAASLECLAPRAARAAARSGADRAGGGRAAGSARSPGEDADRLRPPFPSRSRSRHRAVRAGGGARAVLCVCALCAGRCLHERGDYARAIAEFDKAIELGGRSVNHIGVLGYAWPVREIATEPSRCSTS